MKPLDESTIEFIKENKLADSVAWLQEAAPQYFSDAELEIDVLPVEGTTSMLALKVHGNFSVAGFRLRRHALYAELHKNGHERLYENLSIFQRREGKE